MNNDEEEAKRLSLLLNEETSETTADDFEMAKMMQEQFDREDLNYIDSVRKAGLVVCFV